MALTSWLSILFWSFQIPNSWTVISATTTGSLQPSALKLLAVRWLNLGQKTVLMEEPLFSAYVSHCDPLFLILLCSWLSTFTLSLIVILFKFSSIKIYLNNHLAWKDKFRAHSTSSGYFLYPTLCFYCCTMNVNQLLMKLTSVIFSEYETFTCTNTSWAYLVYETGMGFGLCVLYLYFQALPFYTQFNSLLFFSWSSLKVCVADAFVLSLLPPLPFFSQRHCTHFYSEVIFLHCQNSCVSSNIKNSHIRSGSIFIYGFSLYSHKPTSPKVCSLKGKLRGETSDIFSFL